VPGQQTQGPLTQGIGLARVDRVEGPGVRLPQAAAPTTRRTSPKAAAPPAKRRSQRKADQ